MSAFHRVIFSTFLFLALGCFWASSAFAVTTHYYHSSSASPTSGTCGLQPKPFCDAHFTAINTSNNLQNVGCETQSNNPNYYYLLTKTRGTTYSNGQPITVWNDAPPKLITSRNSFVCQDGEKFELIGCTPKCVTDPCAPLKDQQFSGNGECGSFTCPNGGVVQSSGNTSYCSKGTPTLSYSPPQLGVNTRNSCAGVYKSHVNNASVEPSLNGATGGSFYCSATFTYTGKTGTPENEKTLNALTGGATAMPEDGICKDPTPLSGMLNGTPVCYPNELPDSSCPVQGEKPNSTGLCVPPDDPTYPKDTDPTKPDPKVGCDAGKIKNASGVCVPYADATKCDVGMIRSNTGVCVVDPKATKCQQGQVKNASGACVTDPKGTGCKNDALPDKLGVCPTGESACSTGKVRDASGACVGKNPNAPPDGTGCKDGSTPNAQGVCADGSGACSPGKVRSSSGACVLDTSDGNTSGSSSSNCEVAPECGGDPLQCASLEQIWRSGCDQIKAMSEISQEDADKMASAASAAKTEGESHQAAVDSQAEGFFSDFETKANAVSSSAECISDASFSVMGKSLIVPFSQACPFFKFLRLLVLFSAYMLSARILFGGVS